MGGLALALALVAPLDAMRLIRPGIRSPALQMCASEVAEVGVEVGVEAAARDVRNLLRLELVRSFVEATERGDAATLMQLCTDDFLYKTHRATTSSLLAAKDRFATRLPAPSKVTNELRVESPDLLVRDIVVKPVPFVTVSIRQEFEVRSLQLHGGLKLCRAEFIKQ